MQGMDKTHHKIMMVSFVGFAFIAGYVMRTMLEVLASTFGFFSLYYDMDIVKHGMPALAGVLLFAYLVASKSKRTWAAEVIGEVAKVVWPSKKDTTALTIVVTIIILIAGAMLGVFDFFSKNIINLIMDITI